MRKIIKVFEHETLKVDQTRNGVTFGDRHFNALAEYNEQNDNKFYTLVHKGIKFKQYVGVIQVGRITIEILPKIDSVGDGNESLWQTILFKMLRECKFIKMDSFSEAQLKYKYHSLLDLYFEEYIKEVDALIREGLTKQYRKNKANTSALKGSIRFSKHIAKNLIHKERFYTEHSVYDYQHLINQILLSGLNVLNIVNKNSALADKIKRTHFQLPEFEGTVIKKQSFDRLTYDRKTIRYKQAVEIAKMLILNYSPDITGGDNNLLALLFDMNNLWEEYIFRKLRNAEDSTHRQLSRSFWKSDSVHKNIRPDLRIGNQNVVLDTKWKKLNTDKLDDSDLQQMYIYNRYLDVSKAYLIYPGFKTSKVLSGNYTENNSESHLLTVNPLDELGNLNKSIGNEILTLL